MEQTSSPRQRLAACMDTRREDLRLTWAEVAKKAGVSRETLRQIRNGEGEIRPLTRRGIEDALGWAPGSITAILAGGEPTLAGASKDEGRTRDEPGAEHEDDDLLTPEERRLIERVRRDPDVRRRLLDAILAGHGQTADPDVSDVDKTPGREVS